MIDFDWGKYQGNYLIVTVMEPGEFEIDEVLSSKHDMDSALREMNFMSNKRSSDLITALWWYEKKRKYMPLSPPYPGTYVPRDVIRLKDISTLDLPKADVEKYNTTHGEN